MKKRKTLIVAVACLILAIVIVPVAAYAWFTSGSRTPVDLELLEHPSQPVDDGVGRLGASAVHAALPQRQYSAG